MGYIAHIISRTLDLTHYSLPMEIKQYNLIMIKPETAIKILAKNGIEASLEDSKKILELLIFLVNLSVDQILDQE